MTDIITHRPAPLAIRGAEFKVWENWRCGCGYEYGFGPYAAAHWDDQLTNACTNCGDRRTFYKGRVVKHWKPGTKGKV